MQNLKHVYLIKDQLIKEMFRLESAVLRQSLILQKVILQKKKIMQVKRNGWRNYVYTTSELLSQRIPK